MTDEKRITVVRLTRDETRIVKAYAKTSELGLSQATGALVVMAANRRRALKDYEKKRAK